CFWGGGGAWDTLPAMRPGHGPGPSAPAAARPSGAGATNKPADPPPPAPPRPAAPAPPAVTPKLRVYVTNEMSGDLTVINGESQTVIGTYKLGKRPRGIQVSPDGKSLYVALSGSPNAGPGVDPKT